MSDRVFVDTNVLVYSIDASEKRKCPTAQRQMARLWEERSGRVSYQVLSEFYVTVTRKLSPGLSPMKARDIVRDLFAWRPLPVDAPVIDRAWGLMDRFSLSYRDALIVAAANLCEAKFLLSEDLQAGLEIDGTVVLNPFHGGGA